MTSERHTDNTAKKSSPLQSASSTRLNTSVGQTRISTARLLTSLSAFLNRCAHFCSVLSNKVAGIKPKPLTSDHIDEGDAP